MECAVCSTMADPESMNLCACCERPVCDDCVHLNAYGEPICFQCWEVKPVDGRCRYCGFPLEPALDGRGMPTVRCPNPNCRTPILADRLHAAPDEWRPGTHVGHAGRRRT